VKEGNKREDRGKSVMKDMDSTNRTSKSRGAGGGGGNLGG